MRNFVFSVVIQGFLLIFLLKKDKNDGEKELFRRQQWKPIDVVIVVILINSYPLLFLFLSYIFSMLDLNLYKISSKLGMLIAYVYLLLVLAYLFVFKFKQNIKILGLKKAGLKKNISLGLLIAFVSYLMVDGLYFLLWPNHYTMENIKLVKNLNSFLDYFLLFLIAFILGPFIEEIVYRGILYSPFRKKYGPMKAIIISSIFFTIIHFVLPTFIFSLLLGFLYEKTESLISTIVAHSIYNLFVTLTAFYLML